MAGNMFITIPVWAGLLIPLQHTMKDVSRVPEIIASNSCDAGDAMPIGTAVPRHGGEWDAGLPNLRHVAGTSRAAISMPPVSQLTRISNPAPSRDSMIVPPHDMPVAKKLMVECAGRSMQVR